jgi:hypothetical protein
LARALARREDAPQTVVSEVASIEVASIEVASIVKRSQKIIESVYERVANEEDARVCKDISETACREVPGNFFRIVLSSILTKTGDALINPKTVLAWLVQFMGAPSFVLAMLVPVRESGSMIPQLGIAAWVRSKPVRKWVWVLGALLQGAAVAGIALAALSMQGAAAGYVVLAALTVFSLSRGLCSVASKDVLGKSIPKTRRGLVSGIAAGGSGLVVAGVGLWMYFGRPGDAGIGFYATLLFVAAGFWFVAAFVYATIVEEPGETRGGGNAAADALRSLGLLKSDAAFRNFVITRALMMSSALVAPFYVVLAKDAAEASASMLGLLVLAGGVAASISAPIWGRMADVSSRRVLLLSAALAGLLGILLFALDRSVELPAWIWPLAFLILAIAHSGVRIGRKTYLVDMAGGNKRTDYVAVSNTAIGILLLVVGGITAALSFLGAEMMILILSLTALLGAGFGLSLPEVE